MSLDLSFDPEKLIKDAIKDGFNSAAVEEIDERDLNWCPNIVSWITDPSYLGVTTIYPIQLQVMLKLFGDVCPYCSDWAYYNRDFEVTESLGNLLDKIQILKNGRCPKCKSTRLQHYHEGLWTFPHEIDLLWGMRSGKSAIVGMIASYVLHMLIAIPNPSSYYRLLKGSLLVMRFVALTSGQAEETIWNQFVRSIENCAWFDQYHDFLKHHEKKLGFVMHKWLVKYFAYMNKSLLGYFSGAAIDTSRGRTACFSAFDEIGWWLGSDTGKRANAHETYTAYEKASRTIRNAAMSRFLGGDPHVPTALMAVVSSTSSKADYIMKLVKAAKMDTKKVASHKASWEINPEFAKNPDELRLEREKNYKTFMRDYGSVPPFASDPFIDNESAVDKSTLLTKIPWLVKEGSSDIGLYLDASNIQQDNIPYLLSLDLGTNNCGYAATLLKLKEEDFSKIQVAGAFAIYPYDGKVVDLHNMYEKFIKPLCERLNVRMVIFDQWQSRTQVDALKNMDIAAEIYSLTYDDFDNFRRDLYQGKLETVIPELPLADIDTYPDTLEALLHTRPYLHLLWQILSVAEIGSKITKGEGHDDLFRALVLGCAYLWHEDYRRLFEYKGGNPIHTNRSLQSRLVAAAQSKSGHGYQTSGNKILTYQGAKRPLGSISAKKGPK